MKNILKNDIKEQDQLEINISLCSQNFTASFKGHDRFNFIQIFYKEYSLLIKYAFNIRIFF